MNILVTGSNGFIAKELISRFEKKPIYTLYKTNRQTLNILDTDAVDKFFDKNKVDIVLHCAISGGRRTKPDGPDVVYNNLLMFENLAKNRNKYGLMINFSTGAERDKAKGVDRLSEIDFTLHNKAMPKDYYGFSKYVIAKRIDDINGNIMSLRIFNVFGEFEAPDRMIKNNIANYINNKPIEIHRNRYMDFFGPNDLFAVVEYIINNKIILIGSQSINLCYEEKHSLTDVASMINSLNEHSVPWKIGKMGSGLEDPPYNGNGTRLRSLNLKLLGLKQEIQNVYKKIKENYE